MARHSSPAESVQGFDIADALAVDESQNFDSSDEDFLGTTSGARRSTGSERDAHKTKSKVASRNGHANNDSRDDDADGDDIFIAAQLAASNRAAANSSKGSKRSGGFQSMGLNPNLMKAITRKGFSLPTPIQRKAIPLILENQDVVGMARTGSGKTAAFVIPMIEKLKMHSVKVGARAILLSPSRELALQTLKAVKDFGKGTDLRTILLVGGDSLEEQFSQMASNPDVIIATPGRFLHLQVEMVLDLSSVRYLVFDEADRLFEMGFASQLTEILHALPAIRQTLLFSATLPKSLVEFAKAGLKDPNLVRLDAESKISPDLESTFLSVKPHDKDGALLHLLKDVLKVPGRAAEDKSGRSDNNLTAGKKRKRESETNSKDTPTEHSTIVFAATKYHVEYLATLLEENGYAVSFVYGNLDQTARKMQVDYFRQGRTNLLIVTDIAARGIDIPMLANVINYDFPAQPKVFVHRVGRTARAGRRGWAYTLVQDSDVPYLLDLQLFLGRKLVLGREGHSKPSFAEDIVFGAIPTQSLEVGNEMASKLLDTNDDLQAMRQVANKGEKQYLRSRNQASAQSAKRAKDIVKTDSLRQLNWIYSSDGDEEDVMTARDRMLATISSFRPAETVFEIGARGHVSETADTIQRTRTKIEARRARQKAELENEARQLHAVEGGGGGGGDDDHDDHAQPTEELDGLTQHVEEIQDSSSVFGNSSEEEMDVDVDEPQMSSRDAAANSWQDAEHYMGYRPKATNAAEDRAYGVHTGGSSKMPNFHDAARGALLDLGADEASSYSEASKPNQMRWDKRSKKYVSRANDEDGSRGAKMIRGESGQKIAASFRSGRFDAWKRSNRLDRLPRTGEIESTRAGRNFADDNANKRFKHKSTSKGFKQPDKYRDDYFKQKKRIAQAKEDSLTTGNGRTGARSEIRGVEDIRKQRDLKQKRRDKNARPSKKKKF